MDFLGFFVFALALCLLKTRNVAIHNTNGFCTLFRFLSSAGFVLFYDFVSGIDMSVQVLRLVAVLHKVTAEVRDPAVLPKVNCDSLTSTVYGDTGKGVVIGAVQSHSE